MIISKNNKPSYSNGDKQSMKPETFVFLHFFRRPQTSNYPSSPNQDNPVALSSAGSDGSDTKILVIDDSAYVRMLVRNILNGQGYHEVIEAENGEEALRKYESEKPKLVLLDNILPDLDGTKVLIKIMNKDENVKVIMLMTEEQEKMVKIYKKLGCSGYIIKPFSIKELLDVVEKIFHASNPKPLAKQSLT